MPSLKLTLSDALKTAMKAREAETVSVLRSLQSAIKQIEIDTRTELDDTQVLGVLEKQLKQRKESITAFTAAGRQDLADKEQAEATILSGFLPAALTDSELDALIEAEIQSQGASSVKDMGKVMNALRPQIMGKADTAAVSARIKARLSS